MTEHHCTVAVSVNPANICRANRVLLFANLLVHAYGVVTILRALCRARGARCGILAAKR